MRPDPIHLQPDTKFSPTSAKGFARGGVGGVPGRLIVAHIPPHFHTSPRIDDPSTIELPVTIQPSSTIFRTVNIN